MMLRGIAVISAVGFVLAGCAGQPQSRDEAGSVLLSVSAVRPWSEIADLMSPGFTEKADTMVTQVIASTQRTQEQLLQALGVTAALSLPTTSTTGNVQRVNGGAPTSTITNNFAPGASSSPSYASAPSISQPNAVNPIPSGDPGIDPLLQFQAARNLWQSVQLMNHEMQLITSGSCYEPYIVMAKLAVNPYRSNVDLAVQARMSFFPQATSGHLSTDPSNSQKTACNQETWLPRVVPILAADDLERAVRSSTNQVATQISFALAGMIHGIGGNLGVNELNESLHAISGSNFNNRMTISREADNTIGIRINPSLDTGSGDIDQSKPSRRLIGQNYDIALIVLIPKAVVNAANASKDSRYLQVYLDTQFHDPDNNKPLTQRSELAFASQVKDVFSEAVDGDFLLNPTSHQNLYDQYTKIKDAEWAQLGRLMIYFAHRNAYDDLASVVKNPDYSAPGMPNVLKPDAATKAFIKDALATISGNTDHVTINPDDQYITGHLIPALWNGASRLLTDDPVQVVMAPIPPRDTLMIPDQTVVLTMDGKGGTTGVLLGVGGNAPPPLQGTITLNDQTTKLASAAVLDNSTRTLTMSFPTYSTLSDAKKLKTDGSKVGQLVLKAVCGGESTCVDPEQNSFAVVATPAAKPAPAPGATQPQTPGAGGAAGAGAGAAKPLFTIKPPPIGQISDGPTGTGVIGLTFSQFDDTKVTITTDTHAEIDPTRVPAGAMNGTGMVVMKPAATALPLDVDVPLRNLKAGQDFVLTVTGTDTKNPSTYTVKVVAAP